MSSWITFMEGLWTLNNTSEDWLSIELPSGTNKVSECESQPTVSSSPLACAASRPSAAPSGWRLARAPAGRRGSGPPRDPASASPSVSLVEKASNSADQRWVGKQLHRCVICGPLWRAQELTRISQGRHHPRRLSGEIFSKPKQTQRTYC